MFSRLGRFVVAYAPVWIGLWVLLAVGAAVLSPPWDTVTQPGEFQFLPADSPTRVGERLFEKTFPDDLLGSSVVLVVYREDGRELNASQRAFIEQTLQPRLQELAAPPAGDSADPPDEPRAANGGNNSAGSETYTRPVHEFIREVRTPTDEVLGGLLKSPGGDAWLVIVEITTEFLEHRNREIVGAVESVVDQLHNDNQLPSGLHIALTGSAAVGRDISLAKSESADATEFWTVTLIVTLMIVTFRAPLLAMVPLLTLYIAFKVSLELLTIAAGAGWIGLFRGIETYTMVVIYGAGVDYSLFLSARVREELDRGADAKTAAATAIENVGSAVAASAATEIFGIGMLIFASFGKLHQAGITISFGLIVMLAAALTLTPSLLRVCSPWIFWPHSIGFQSAELSRRSRLGRVMVWLTEREFAESAWGRVGQLLKRRPATVFAVTVAVMLVPAAWGVWNFNHLSYGLISQLSPDSPSVQGTRVLQRHFAPGETGHATLLIQDAEVDFTSASGVRLIGELSDRLWRRRDELRIADIRSVSDPFGKTERGEQPTDGQSTFQMLARRAAIRKRAVDYYVSEAEDIPATTTRLDIVLQVDPFTRESILVLDDIEAAIREELPEALVSAGDEGTHLIGSTASIRDLKRVAQNDRLRINVLVAGVVLLVLIVLLRNVPLATYLVASVTFSFLVALGITYVIFTALDPSTFSGLDWTVPLFLFTILVAVGIDYNIFLVSRIAEEVPEHGPIDGVVEALTKTGAIISGCGVIMAGTFLSLMVGGELARMQQLGMALAVGILLDTFFVRPVLVPAFLLLVAGGRWKLPQKWFLVPTRNGGRSGGERTEA